MPLPRSNPSSTQSERSESPSASLSESTHEHDQWRQEANVEDPLTQLQNLLVHPELAKCPSLITDLQQKLVALSQVVQEEEMLERLQPLIRESLSRSCAEYSKLITDSLVSTIDTIIQQRTVENKTSMGSAIGPLLSTAISCQIENSPTDIARAIAPEIAQMIYFFLSY